MKALIVYHTKTGHTKGAADAIARGLKEKGVDPTIKTAASTSAIEVEDYDILLTGTPTYATTMYKGPAKAVAKFLDSLKPSALKGKYAGAFSAYAASGGEKVVASTEHILEGLGATVVVGGPAVKAGAPLSLWQGPAVTDPDLKKCEEFGRKVAETAS